MRSSFGFLRTSRVAAVLLFLLGSCAATRQEPTPEAEKPGYLWNALLGGRSLSDDTAWDEIESPFVLGFEGGNVGKPLGYEVGVSIAGDSTTVGGVDVTNTFLELSAGARAVFGEGRFLPYLGAGIALVSAEVEGESGGLSVSDDDVSIGFYGHGGVLFKVGSRYYLGLDARALTGTEVEMFDIESDADYVQLAFVFGWSI